MRPRPQFRLKDDDQRQQHCRQQVIENATQLGEIETGDDHLRHQEQADGNQAQPADHGGATSFSEQCSRQKMTTARMTISTRSRVPTSS